MNDIPSWGRGFDDVPNRQTFRDFLAWWHSESWFSAAEDEVPEMPEEDEGFPFAA